MKYTTACLSPNSVVRLIYGAVYHTTYVADRAGTFVSLQRTADAAGIVTCDTEARRLFMRKVGCGAVTQAAGLVNSELLL